MAFYHVDPATMRQPEPELENASLGLKGEHLGDVLGALDADFPDTKARIDAYLAAVVPGLASVDRKYVGTYVTVAMRQRLAEASLEFGPQAMSDGTLRAAGVLAALFQPSVRNGAISLVGIEEPEIALHPAAAGVLFDAIGEASEGVQVVASSQSADLLDRDDIDVTAVRAVSFENGQTVIGDIDDASQRVLSQKLMTLGELMRSNQLSPKRGGDSHGSGDYRVDR
jgi:predicted ATPase